MGAADEVEVEVATVDDEDVVDDEAEDVEEELDDAGAGETDLKTFNRHDPPHGWVASPEHF